MMTPIWCQMVAEYVVPVFPQAILWCYTGPNGWVTRFPQTTTIIPAYLVRGSAARGYDDDSVLFVGTAAGNQDGLLFLIGACDPQSRLAAPFMGLMVRRGGSFVFTMTMY